MISIAQGAGWGVRDALLRMLRFVALAGSKDTDSAIESSLHF